MRSKLGQEGKRLAQLSGPIIVGQVGQNLITLADTIMVGALGAVYLGASAFAGSIFIAFIVVGLGLLSPVTALFAKIQGEGQYSQGGVLLQHSLAVALGLSAVLIGISYLLLPNLSLLGQTSEVLILATPFFELIAWSILPTLLYQNYKQFTDGIGQTKVAMYIMVFGVVFNIIANYGLIHGAWGLPRLGLNGSAWATLMARTLMAVIIIGYVHFNTAFKIYLTKPWSSRLQQHHIRNILRLGIPNGLTYLFEAGAFSSAAIIMGWFGSGPLAAHQITISLASMSFLVTMGLGIAASIRVGFELGRRDFPQARFAGFTAIGIGALYMSLCGVGFMLLRHWLPTLYVTDEAVISLAASLFVVVAIFQVFDGTQAVAIGALRGLSDTKMPSLIAFFAYWVVGLPLGCFLAFYGGVGPIGVWIGLLIGLIFVSALLSLRFHLLSRALVQKRPDYSKTSTVSLTEIIP